MTATPSLRPGSTGYLASEQLRVFGPMTTAALAATIDKPEDELTSLLAFPVRLDLLRFDAAADRWSLGDGSRRQPEPPAPLAPEPPPAIQRHVIPPAVRDLPAAAPPAARKTAPPAARAPDSTGVDIDRVHGLRMTGPAKKATTQQQVRAAIAKAAAISPEPAPAVPPPEQAPKQPEPVAPPPPPPPPPARTAPSAREIPMPGALLSSVLDSALTLPAAVADCAMVAAFCSDETYVIEKVGNRLELDLGEALVLYDHLRATFKGVA